MNKISIMFAFVNEKSFNHKYWKLKSVTLNKSLNELGLKTYRYFLKTWLKQIKAEPTEKLRAPSFLKLYQLLCVISLNLL